jgi:hypothetical protein
MEWWESGEEQVDDDSERCGLAEVLAVGAVTDVRQLELGELEMPLAPIKVLSSLRSRWMMWLERRWHIAATISAADTFSRSSSMSPTF